jgi:hypothetical protein
MIEIAPAGGLSSGQTISLEFFDPRGFVIDAYALRIGSAPAPEEDEMLEEAGSLELIQNDSHIFIKGSDFTLVFDRRTGSIEKSIKNGWPILQDGPTLILLPLKSGPCNTEHSLDIQPLNSTCRDWRVKSVEARETEEQTVVEIKGRYKEAEGMYRLHVNSAGEMVLYYAFTVLEAVNPRQVGVVFTLPSNFRTLSWKRRAQWSVYPKDHIGRPEGVAKAFRGNDWPSIDLRIKPPWPWSLDQNAMGTRDFRATRNNILWAALRPDEGPGIKVLSDGTQSVRAFVEDGRVKLLVADFSTGGADIFLASHYQHERRPLEAGDLVEGEVELAMLPGE